MTNPLPGIIAWVRKNIRVGVEHGSDLFGDWTIRFVALGRYELSMALHVSRVG